MKNFTLPNLAPILAILCGTAISSMELQENVQTMLRNDFKRGEHQYYQTQGIGEHPFGRQITRDGNDDTIFNAPSAEYINEWKRNHVYDMEWTHFRQENGYHSDINISNPLRYQGVEYKTENLLFTGKATTGPIKSGLVKNLVHIKLETSYGSGITCLYLNNDGTYGEAKPLQSYNSIRTTLNYSLDPNWHESFGGMQPKIYETDNPKSITFVVD